MGALLCAIHYTEVVLQCCLLSHVFFHISAFVSINPLLSSPLFLTLTQLPYTILIISPLDLLYPLLLHHHPCLLSLINQLFFALSTFTVLCILAPCLFLTKKLCSKRLCDCVAAHNRLAPGRSLSFPLKWVTTKGVF